MNKHQAKQQWKKAKCEQKQIREANGPILGKGEYMGPDGQFYQKPLGDRNHRREGKSWRQGRMREEGKGWKEWKH